jgi:hypothetical protein
LWGENLNADALQKMLPAVARTVARCWQAEKLLLDDMQARAAGFEISRVTRAINALESSLSHHRTSTIAAIFPHDIPLIETELALQGKRLHELLLDRDDEKKELHHENRWRQTRRA